MELKSTVSNSSLSFFTGDFYHQNENYSSRIPKTATWSHYITTWILWSCSPSEPVRIYTQTVVSFCYISHETHRPWLEVCQERRHSDTPVQCGPVCRPNSLDATEFDAADGDRTGAVIFEKALIDMQVTITAEGGINLCRGVGTLDVSRANRANKMSLFGAKTECEIFQNSDGN